MNNEPLVTECTFNAPIDRVWQAITDKEQMKKWYFDIPEFKPEVGAAFTFEGGDENKTFVHLCRVTEIVPGQKLTHSWRYEGYEGESFVSFELFEEAIGTRLKLTHAGLETFPSDTTDFARSNFEAGWAHIIGTSLKEFLEGPTRSKVIDEP
jgi:uncharacterized protein YndB with AHSA1/START domain